jgi:hypothetical protein
MNLEFTFLKDDPLNSSIVSSEGQPQYTVDTPWKLVNRTTTVAFADGQSGILATIEWHWFTPATLTLRGQEMSLEDWLTAISPFAL